MKTYFGKFPEVRVFLDTNVLVSAFATRGICEDIFREVLTFHQFVSSETVILELGRVLKGKFSVPKPVRTEIRDFLRSNAEMGGDSRSLQLSLSDESDIIIVSEAVAGNVDILVTGDQEVVALRQVEGMRILSPREFWEFLQSESGETP